VINPGIYPQQLSSKCRCQCWISNDVKSQKFINAALHQYADFVVRLFDSFSKNFTRSRSLMIISWDIEQTWCLWFRKHFSHPIHIKWLKITKCSYNLSYSTQENVIVELRSLAISYHLRQWWQLFFTPMPLMKKQASRLSGVPKVVPVIFVKYEMVPL